MKSFDTYWDYEMVKDLCNSLDVVTAYVEQLGKTHSAPSVKQHLAAVRMLEACGPIIARRMARLSQKRSFLRHQET